jgi:hypothetical protein
MNKKSELQQFHFSEAANKNEIFNTFIEGSAETMKHSKMYTPFFFPHSINCCAHCSSPIGYNTTT